MPMDSMLLAALRRELSEKLKNAKVDRINQPSRPSVIFALRAERTEHLAVWAGASPRIYLASSSYENPPEPPMFCMLLRKYLGGARINSVGQPNFDRVLAFDMTATDLFGGSEKRTLVVELLGRSPNIILLDGDGIITDCLYRNGSLGEKRAVLPGLRYLPPPKTGKMYPPEVTPGAFTAHFASADGGTVISKWLTDSFDGISPLIARELAFRAYGDVDMRIAAALGADGGAAMEKTWRGYIETVSGSMTAYVIHDENGEPMDVTYMPIFQYGPRYELRQYDSFSAALEYFYARREAEERQRQRASDITRQVRTRRDRVARKAAAQERELAAAQDRETMRENGDLITSSLHLMKKGMASFEAEDYYRGGVREIKLDPLKTPQQNAAKYYRDYTKAKTAEKYLTRLLQENKEELEYLESVLTELALAENMRDVAEIRAELEAAGVLKTTANGKKQRGAKPSAPMEFTAPDGTRILVGKNNVQNDTLTFKTARRDDLWLHAQKIHGSHVVICCAGDEPAEETLIMAAGLAAYYSDGRENGKTAVDCTRVKFVKKPSGAKPGAVIYTDYKTIITAPRLPKEES